MPCQTGFAVSILFLLKRPFAQLWPGNEVRSIAGENRPRCVCFSLELSFFFCFGMSFSDHCCVPRCSNRGRACPSLFSHSFPQSDELKKRWLLAICQMTDRLSLPQQHGYIEHVIPAKIFRSDARAYESVDSSITSSLKMRKALHFPKAGAVPSVFSLLPYVSQVRVHTVCIRGDDWAILGVQEARLFWTAIDCVLFFFPTTLLDERCSNLSFENPNSNPKNRTLNSHKVTGGLRGVYCGRWQCMDTNHSRKSAFLPFS